MRYDPANGSAVFPAGLYKATIRRVSCTAEDGSPLKTRDGLHDLEKITFEVYVGDQIRLLTESFSNSEAALWRYRVLASALEQKEAFKAGTFQASAHVGDALQLQVAVEDDDRWGERNRVARMFKRDYKPPEPGKAEPRFDPVPEYDRAGNEQPPPTDDSIPF